MLENTAWFWIVFNLSIFILIYIDLKVFHSQEKVLTVKEALLATSFWIGLALAFNVAVYFSRGAEDALNFFTGYLIEYSLSVDNLFVFLLIFSYFHVPHELTHKVLFWGILGAIIMRAVFILFGIALIQKFAWIIYVFGIFLIYTGVKLWLSHGSKTSPEDNIFIKLFKHYFPVTDQYEEGKFFVRRKSKLYATPLFLVLLAVETTDVIFAIDSIPAIIGITTDIVIVYSSNIFAVLGLRSLFFALSGMMRLFRFLHYGLAIILVFIGFKMLLSKYYHLPVWLTLGTICLILTGSIILSILSKQDDDPTHRKS